ncbi:MAG TPA: MBL fold metallo-hydrolase [Saprospiraceae bacterium]|jgi:metallo-beta-lactamase family protein|nr:MBL fold metallo-hydrolase [Saprospiraceae bacterium]HRO07674.1 MBL fold metallo-hydrolase [Saprospiraceae bacterium]HRO72303.1 MBL fold metallo-hydrolase [Saprospiraceae bacterium]HRP40956.1 MBL fold metallo-hydrolase [Saprospiraceae bacterium]
MKIRFCGAARYVTGSSHLVILDNGFKILLDCGLFQGRGDETWEWNNHWYFDPAEIDCMVLSHAHIDHCGRIPKLVKDGYKGPIHATHATRSLCAVMLMDSARIQENDIEWFNEKIIKGKRKNKEHLREPLYIPDDVGPAMVKFEGHAYDRWQTIHPDVQVLFRDAGHILGSASVTLKINENGKETLLGFTGDIGRADRPILRDPVPMPEVDYLICESTYGDRLHDKTPEQSNEFLEIINEACVNKKGKLLIPAFSLGRTQEIIYMLDKLSNQNLLPPIKVYVDSPLAVNVTHIFQLHPECFDEEINRYIRTDSNPFGFNNLIYVRDVEQSKILNTSKEPCIIVSAAGMLNAGRSKHHLYNSVDNPKNTILIVGYCTPETPGGVLRSGAKTIRLFDDEKPVLADIRIMDSFSGHGDRDEMLTFIINQKGHVKKIFLVHGEPEVQDNFKLFLIDKGMGMIDIPTMGSEVQL